MAFLSFPRCSFAPRLRCPVSLPPGPAPFLAPHVSQALLSLPFVFFRAPTTRRHASRLTPRWPKPGRSIFWAAPRKGPQKRRAAEKEEYRAYTGYVLTQPWERTNHGGGGPAIVAVITPFFPSLGGFLQNFLCAPNDAAVDGDVAAWSLPSKQTKFGDSILWNTEDPEEPTPKPKQEEISPAVDVESAAAGGSPGDNGVNYVSRAQWLRAAVLGANDGLVTVASLMIGVGAVNEASRAMMLVSGLAGLVSGACSMAIGEFVSVYAQYDIEAAQIERTAHSDDDEDGSRARDGLPSPARAAIPLLAGGFVPAWTGRVAAVCAASSVGLAGFGVAGAYLGGASCVVRSGARVLVGGWLAMATTYGVLKLFGMHGGV